MLSHQYESLIAEARRHARNKAIFKATMSLVITAVVCLCMFVYLRWAAPMNTHDFLLALAIGVAVTGLALFWLVKAR